MGSMNTMIITGTNKDEIWNTQKQKSYNVGQKLDKQHGQNREEQQPNRDKQGKNRDKQDIFLLCLLCHYFVSACTCFVPACHAFLLLFSPVFFLLGLIFSFFVQTKLCFDKCLNGTAGLLLLVILQ